MESYIDTFRQNLTAQRYSPNSVKTYVNCVSSFLEMLKKYDPKNITAELVEKYIIRLVKEKK